MRLPRSSVYLRVMYTVAIEALVAGDRFYVGGFFSSHIWTVVETNWRGGGQKGVTLTLENGQGWIHMKTFKTNKMVSVLSGPTAEWRTKIAARQRPSCCECCCEETFA